MNTVHYTRFSKKEINVDFRIGNSFVDDMQRFSMFEAHRLLVLYRSWSFGLHPQVKWYFDNLVIATLTLKRYQKKVVKNVFLQGYTGEELDWLTFNN